MSAFFDLDYVAAEFCRPLSWWQRAKRWCLTVW